ncbi:MAG: hypothetical protein JWN74_494 [Acidobacteriaceae bacterium]|nr:hypothetical protein [Acidobacteriaceae bacterium]
MERENAERFRKLCEKAAIEQDHKKLRRLIAEITRLLEEKEQRLRRNEDDTRA